MKNISKYIGDLSVLAGCISIIYAAFQYSKLIGFVVMGILMIALGVIMEIGNNGNPQR